MKTTRPIVLLAGLFLVASAGCARDANENDTVAAEAERTSGGDAVAVRAETPEQPTAPPLVATDSPDVCVEATSYFAFDSAELDDADRAVLDQLAQCIKDRRVNAVIVTGHADPRGTEEHNHELGMERAEAVAAYLESRGVTRPEVRVRSVGENGATENELSWAADRRVEVELQGPGV